MTIRRVKSSEKNIINEIAAVHISTFEGFFLTFMEKGFLSLMYRSYCEHRGSGLLAAFAGNRPVGFLAYSGDMSGLYRYMLKRHFFGFAFYSVCAFLKRPSVFMKLIGALAKPEEAERKEKYVELSSIGVSPAYKNRRTGSRLVRVLIDRTDFGRYSYIKLETDAAGNDAANRFYRKNGFELAGTYTTKEGRIMNEYRYSK